MMTRLNRDEIEASLRENVETKRTAYFVARQEFDKAIKPSGIPQPDGTVSIRNAGGSHTNAIIQAYRLALVEHHDFYLRGSYPIDSFWLDHHTA
jgi:hypothetical protein